jgi:hypothetical protein
MKRRFQIPEAGMTLQPQNPTQVELSAGAAQLGIPMPVAVPRRLLEDYAPLDPTLGLNTAGVLLSLVAYRISATSRTQAAGVITACLIRREDDQWVELDLKVCQSGVNGQRRLWLELVEERVVRGGVADQPGPGAKASDPGLCRLGPLQGNFGLCAYAQRRLVSDYGLLNASVAADLGRWLRQLLNCRLVVGPLCAALAPLKLWVVRRRDQEPVELDVRLEAEQDEPGPGWRLVLSIVREQPLAEAEGANAE